MNLCVCVLAYVCTAVRWVNVTYEAGQGPSAPLTVTLHPRVCGVQQTHYLNFMQVLTTCVYAHTCTYVCCSIHVY